MLVCIMVSLFLPFSMEDLPPITALAFRDSLNMAVGTATGQVAMGRNGCVYNSSISLHNSAFDVIDL